MAAPACEPRGSEDEAMLHAHRDKHVKNTGDALTQTKSIHNNVKHKSKHSVETPAEPCVLHYSSGEAGS